MHTHQHDTDRLQGRAHDLGIGAGVILALALLYTRVIRPWANRWGATDEELARAMPGDDLVERPNYVTTRAVTIHAGPDEVWPWLVQMGYRRGGLYSYDWLDRFFGYLDRPSAEVILPDFQRLEVGDAIPIGRGPSWPVRLVERERALVLEPLEGTLTWSFGLYPIGGASTRLVTRVRFRIGRRVRSLLVGAVIDPAAFVMTRKMLLGIKARAERRAAGELRVARSLSIHSA